MQKTQEIVGPFRDIPAPDMNTGEQTMVRVHPIVTASKPGLAVIGSCIVHACVLVPHLLVLCCGSLLCADTAADQRVLRIFIHASQAPCTLET